jgi:serine/threonine-protein kinase HipA
MTGHENTLNIYLGNQVIAHLSLQDEQLALQYTQDWQQSGYSISPHLPLTGQIPSINIQRYLRNLFPEGDIFETLLRNLHLRKHNTFGIIRALGADTSGALLFLPDDQTPPTSSTFRLITPIEIEKRLDDRDEYNLIIWDGKPRLSMAGVQDKINVTITESGQMGFGEGSLCSTHLLKFEKQKLSHLALNEYLSMQLAKQCGIHVADTQLLRFGKYPTLLVERFDRKLITPNEVARKHVIDGCQALNLAPEYKYERNLGSGRDVAHVREGASLIKLLDFANQCVNPAETKNKILDWALFNLLINNYDAHGKNISFFVNKGELALTPFYDLINIKMYPQFEKEIAMAIGDDFDGETIAAYQLADFADNCQLSRLYLTRQLKNLASTLLTHCSENTLLAIAKNKEEKYYIEQYQKTIQEHCKYLLAQADDIPSVKL